jgi:error-prone DNA polymerase
MSVRTKSRLVAVTGKVQNESNVVHILAERLEDMTPLLNLLRGETIALQPQRFSGSSDTVETMPKGRNFH